MTIEQLKKKIKYGDYNTLGKMLDLAPSTAKQRFYRKEKQAIKAITLIIENREKMIYDFKNQKLDF